MKKKLKRNSVVLLTASAFILFLSLVTSCSNNSNEEDMVSNLSAKVTRSNMREISLSEIPKGITPYVVKNDEELSELINKFENTQAVMSSPLIVDSVINNRSFKVQDHYSSSDSFGVYQICYSVMYDNERKSSTITISSGLSGFHPMIEWIVTSKIATWVTPYSFDWTLQGYLSLYVQYNGKTSIATNPKSYGGHISIPRPIIPN
jgi:hypothetical protein